MKIFSKIAVSVLALLVADYLIPGITIDGLYPAVISAVILIVMMFIARPILIILTLPVTIVTFGLFLFVINAILFYFVASFVEGFNVDGFLSALLGSIIVSLITAITNKLLK